MARLHLYRTRRLTTLVLKDDRGEQTYGRTHQRAQEPLRVALERMGGFYALLQRTQQLARAEQVNARESLDGS